MAQRRLFRPFLLDSKLEKTKKKGFNTNRSAEMWASNHPRGEPFRRIPIYSCAAWKSHRDEEREQANAGLREEPQV